MVNLMFSLIHLISNLEKKKSLNPPSLSLPIDAHTYIYSNQFGFEYPGNPQAV